MFAVNFDQGQVISVGDGIANINGLNDVMSGELLFFPPSALKSTILKNIMLQKKIKNTFT
jgi:F0F1-type ATP synthase alpha subunit